jgi:hypothetical protein
MIALELGHEHRGYKGPYTEIDPHIQHKLAVKPKRGRVVAMILSALGIFS